MAELKEFLKEIGLPEDLADKDVPTVKEGFFGTFVNRAIAMSGEDREIASAIMGKKLGFLEAKFARDMGLAAEEVKEKKFEELIEYTASKTKTRLSELEAAVEEARKSGGDEKLTKAMKDLEKERNEKKQYADQLTEYKNTFEQKEQELMKKLKGEKLNFHISSIKSKVPLVDNVPEITRKGFDAVINEKYQFELDENENPVVKDKEGKLIQNDAKSGFMTVEDVLKKEAQAAGILKMNGATAPRKAGTPPPNNQNQKPLRTLPSSALRNAERS